MSGAIRHRGLRRLHEQGDSRGVTPKLQRRVRRVLLALERAECVATLDVLPGMRLHRLYGKLAGRWSIAVSGNHRVVFRLAGQLACDVDLLDYH